MKVVLAVVAGAANLSVDGNLNVHEIFDTIPTRTVPVAAPPMVVVYTIGTEAGDPSPVGLTVEMLDGAGGSVLKWNSAIIGGPPASGKLAYLHLVLPCPRELVFTSFGLHRVLLFAGDEYLAEAVFQVVPADDVSVRSHEWTSS